MDYFQFWKQGWNYYRDNPIFIVPYLIWFALSLSFGTLVLPQLLQLMKGGVVGGVGLTVTYLLLALATFALVSEIVSRLLTGWVLEMVNLVDEGEEIDLKSSFASYKGKIVSYIGAGLLKYLLVFIIPAVLVSVSIVSVAGSQGPLTNMMYSTSLSQSSISNLVGQLFNPLIISVMLLSGLYIIIASFLLLFVDQSVIVGDRSALAALKKSFNFVKNNLASTLFFLIIFFLLACLIILPPVLFFTLLTGALAEVTGITAISSISSVLNMVYIYALSPLFVSVLVLFFKTRQQV